MATVRELLNSLGFQSGDHDQDVRDALIELDVERQVRADAAFKTARLAHELMNDLDEECGDLDGGDDDNA